MGYWVRNVFLCLALCILCVPASAFDFTPSETEWQMWPAYCKARYVSIPQGAAFRSRVPNEEIERWSSRLGSCWVHVHHYCGGLAKLDRSTTGTKQSRDYYLQSAIGEHNYMARNCPRDNQFWSNNQAHLAAALSAKGDVGLALKAVDDGIEQHPTYDGSYIVKSMILSKNMKFSDSLSALLAGDLATDGSSAELKYALGLAYFQEKDYKKSRDYARQAYELGYPLPGLVKKLKEVGYPL